MYADTVSDSMNEAIVETKRRRSIQEEYNRQHGIVPKTIQKEIRDVISNEAEVQHDSKKKMSKEERALTIDTLEKEMRQAASELDFERAMELRDILFEIKGE